MYDCSSINAQTLATAIGFKYKNLVIFDITALLSISAWNWPQNRESFPLTLVITILSNFDLTTISCFSATESPFLSGVSLHLKFHFFSFLFFLKLSLVDEKKFYENTFSWNFLKSVRPAHCRNSTT